MSRILVALGGNALLRRGEPLTAENQRANIRVAAAQLARVAADNQLVIAHGNGPQVGLLALQAAAYTDVEPYPLDVLGAQSDAMIGYMIEQELGNVLPGTELATVLTMTEVDPDDPAFSRPTKPIGPVYDRATADRLAQEKGWTVSPDGDAYRRVIASPEPQRIVQENAVRTLIDSGTLVIAAGGGGIPVVRTAEGGLTGSEAVIDKDLCAGLLAGQVGADLLVIATDVPGVFADWGTPGQRVLRSLSVVQALGLELPAGSMGPKVRAAAAFAQRTGARAVIGALSDIEALVAGTAGTSVAD